MAAMGASLRKRVTQVRILTIRLSSDGGNHPFARLRFCQRGFRYRVFLWRLPRLTALRLSRAFLMACPRWVNSAANTTSPFASLTIASPVVLLPGSILMRNGWTDGCSIAVFKMIVKGYLLYTAALPDESN